MFELWISSLSLTGQLFQLPTIYIFIKCSHTNTSRGWLWDLFNCHLAIPFVFSYLSVNILSSEKDYNDVIRSNIVVFLVFIKKTWWTSVSRKCVIRHVKAETSSHDCLKNTANQIVSSCFHSCSTKSSAHGVEQLHPCLIVCSGPSNIALCMLCLGLAHIRCHFCFSPHGQLKQDLIIFH